MREDPKPGAPARRGARLALAVLLGAGPLACSEAPGGPQPGGTSAPESRRAAAPTPEEVQRLRALGYLDVVEDPARDDPTRRGVVAHDAARSAPGYNLYTIPGRPYALLMDARGRVVHRFVDPGGASWSRAKLMPDGDVLAVGHANQGSSRSRSPERRFVLRMGWDGALRWRRWLPAHHDAEPLPNGHVLTLTMRDRMLPELHPSLPVRDDAIQELDEQGAPLGSLSLIELLGRGPHAIAFQSVDPGEGEDGAVVDLVHANSIAVFDQPQLAGSHRLYAESNLLVTSRHQDVIAVVDWSRRELLFSWGPGELSGPHDASWLASGNLLVFDNGLGRNWSRVVELDPLRGQIVWEYRAPEPESFYSAGRGSAQRLESGQTLVTDSGGGRAFEITPDGEVVWEFLNPEFDARGERRALGRMLRYPPERIDALLAGRAGPGARAAAAAEDH